MTKSTGHRWPNGIVYYEFDAAYPDVPPSFPVALAGMEAATSLRFVPRTNQRDYVGIVNGSGCSSYVGRVGGAQNMSLRRSGCTGVSTTTHEFGHAVGLSHEQTRPDRDQYVRINWDNIQDGRAHNFRIGNYLANGPYDYQSVMHYPSRGFSKNGLPTIEALDPNAPPFRGGVLSPGDIAGIQFLYHTDVAVAATQPAQIGTGSGFQVVVEVSNLGSNDIGNVNAKDIEVSVPLPAGTQFQGADSDSGSWTCDSVAGLLTCKLPSLNRLTTTFLTLDLVAPSGQDQMQLDLAVSSSNRDKNAQNNSTSMTAIIDPGPAVTTTTTALTTTTTEATMTTTEPTTTTTEPTTTTTELMTTVPPETTTAPGPGPGPPPPTANNLTIIGQRGSEQLAGGLGDDHLEGGRGNDTLMGGPGNDILDGGVRRDRLYGGSGDDVLTGGKSRDEFHYQPGDGNDLITDLHRRERLYLTGFGFTSYDQVREMATMSSNGNLMFDFGNGDTLELVGYEMRNLRRMRFVLQAAPTTTKASGPDHTRVVGP